MGASIWNLWTPAARDSTLMSWQRHLVELVAAGGLAVLGCATGVQGNPDSGSNPDSGGDPDSGGGTPRCNGNPDPCCLDPTGSSCLAQQACAASPNACCCQDVTAPATVVACRNRDGGTELPDGGCP